MTYGPDAEQERLAQTAGIHGSSPVHFVALHFTDGAVMKRAACAIHSCPRSWRNQGRTMSAPGPEADLFASDAAIGGTELSPSRFLLDLLPKDFTARLKINDLSQQEWDWFGDWDKKLTVDVSSRPRHGRVDSSSSATYSADPGYTGKDRMEVFVSGKDMAGHPISMKLVYFINVVSDADFHDIAGHYRQSLSKYCHRTNESWRRGQLPARSAAN